MSSITDCFLIDNTSAGPACVYDADRNVSTFFATRYGVSSQTGKGGINVPLFPFSDVEVEDRCVLLLLEAVRASGWASRSAYEKAEQDFARRELPLQRIISSADHHLIPPGHRIAVAEAEYIGRIVVANGQRGVVLFNPDGVIGYKGRGRTSYEHVLGDFLSAAA